MNVKEKRSHIEHRIALACQKSGRNREDLHIIAVTKYVSPERAQEAVDAGLAHLGENRPEGLLEKQHAITGQVEWHYIGSLQTRKVKEVIDHVDYIHSLDRLSLAQEIQKRANTIIKCFVQVNVSGEESKHGLRPEEVVPFIESLQSDAFNRISIVGLMTMAPLTDDKETLRNCFRSLKSLQLTVAGMNFEKAPCTELSMGMSNDYDLAIEEGATFIRIGTALVGED
ncbi:YggS family pyridoxal phosphate-dependent enzyme [Bacillus testis]|uniref:YggS family pyridoxal phosphate-dependent enzyme n=1 Tax=Bacillus testis TaxID=1622072 RepID=UPI00067EDB37|nr:YggS family pyridoxal phosphate-dependent enzyme [Bacillus testis]